MYIRDVKIIDCLATTLHDSTAIEAMRQGLLAGDVYIFRGFESRKKIRQYRHYLETVGRGSLPNYTRIERNVPNFHRMDRWDPRAHVGACAHSFSFFPWNHDVFNLFDRFKPVYHLKNLVSNLPRESFLGNEPDMGCTARLSFHCYPRGCGGLNKHQDPFNYHQITVPIMIMSQKGVDFEEGGAYVERSESHRLILDDVCEMGDVIYFNAQCYHGVEHIDREAKVDWLSFRGRWILLFAVNKLADNRVIDDSKDLDRAPCQ